MTTTSSSTTVPASNGARTTATTAAAAGTSSSSSTQPSLSSKQRLEHRFPVNSSWELTIDPETPPVSGRIYCTDELSQTVVLQTALAHTTLAAEMRIIHVNSITKAQPKPNEEDSSSAAAVPPLAAQQLPKVQKKVLEEREKRAIRMAEESLRHINQKASPEGQLVFDKLLKACNEVVWKGESILVLNHVQVDPPYGPEQCKIVGRSATGKKALDHGSVERIKKIVAAATVNTTTNAS